ncbi:MAG: endonuclease domain-containing protein, partial [Pseudolabrys sp.]|nr:endonuclease domain-containing protein [Pseudolabrys sp.]
MAPRAPRASSPPPLAGEVGPRRGPGGGSISWKIGTTLRANARQLRRNSTEAEKAIWQALRAHRLAGLSFRRQTPIGGYVADFVCHAAKVVIELDGGQHYETAQLKSDARRTIFFKSKGFRVLRFSNAEVMHNREGV